MKTRLMIVSESMPLAGASVEVKGIEGQMTSNADGVVEVELGSETGAFDVIVRHGDRDPTSARVTHHGDHSLMIVNIANTPTGGTGEYVSTLHRSAEELNSRYSLGEVAGRGGMSIVIKAHDRLLNRSVALKLLHEEFGGNDEAQHLFLNEAQSLATLSHPNLVGVHDIIKIEGRAIMVLEFVEGVHLEQIATERDGGIPQSLVLRLGIQLCRAIAYLHTQGFIHRDIKPANLIVKHDGTLKVIDFGLARSLYQISIRGTRVRGTPAYMSPEQILGKELGPASDVYQIGVTLYELLVGQLPFDGEMSYAHVHTDPAPIGERLGADLMPELESIVMRALSKDPDGRQPNAIVMMRELQECYEQLLARGLDESDEAILTELGFDAAAWTQRENGGVTTEFDAIRMTAPELSFGHIADPEHDRRAGLKWAALAIVALGLVGGAIAFYLFSTERAPGQGAARAEAFVAVPAARPLPIDLEPSPAALAIDPTPTPEPEPAPVPVAEAEPSEPELVDEPASPKPKKKRTRPRRKRVVRRSAPPRAPEPEPEPAAPEPPASDPAPRRASSAESRGGGTIDNAAEAPTLFAPSSKSGKSTRNAQGLLP